MRTRPKKRSRSINESGQASGFLAMTAIRPGAVDELRAVLEGFRDRGERPLDKVPGTHMARFVIVEKFNCKPAYRQRRAENIACASLAFSSNVDGSIDHWLEVLCDKLQPEAQEIWGRCIGSPAVCQGRALKDYLEHNQIHSGFFYAAYGEATVAKVKASLDQRDRFIAFATEHQGASPAQLQQAFVERFT